MPTRSPALKSLGRGAELFDDADDLVSGDDAGMFWRKVAFGQVKVGAADAAGDDAHQDLAGAGNGSRLLDETQRIGLDRRGLL